MTPNLNIQPDIKVSLKQTFGIDSEMEVEAFSKKNEYVPEIDKSYKFDRDTTLAIISGFAFNKRVLVQGYHGTGKSTHIEQIAARLNWPCTFSYKHLTLPTISSVSIAVVAVSLQQKYFILRSMYYIELCL